MTKGNNLSDDEKKLFQQEVGNVKPLRQTKPRLNTPPPKPPLIRKPQNIQNNKIQPNITYTINQYLQVSSEEIIAFKQADISNKEFSALKNAKNRYAAKLDLHGLHPNTAEAQLDDFIENACANSIKNVLIIHGKGGQNNKPPIIKNIVNAYLKKLPQVLAFHSAKAQDGGSGAVYVLLRRQKFKPKNL